MTAGYFVCAVGKGCVIDFSWSVLQSLGLGFAEPAHFTQGSRNIILYCDKNLLAKLVETSFCAADGGIGASGRRTLRMRVNEFCADFTSG